ncbi:hypothetical protein C8Q74DRAFT_1308068 [Fomes fomentarius]|nr:hypothetical protein C8Q74DRAFT_1308068 [Fomes fomentarius]
MKDSEFWKEWQGLHKAGKLTNAGASASICPKREDLCVPLSMQVFILTLSIY